MAEDKSIVKPVAAPPLTPLKLPVRLAPTPRQPPRYAVTIQDAQGRDIVLADPQATRALVALMDVHAVNGGAACHWGGPAAFAEINAAIHGLMFAVEGREWHEAFNFVNDAGHAENGLYALRSNYGFDGLTFGSAQHESAQGTESRALSVVEGQSAKPNILLIVVDDAGHETRTPGMRENIVAALDRFAGAQ